MRALIIKEYGSPLKMNFKEIEKPKISSGDLLIKMKYTSLNAADLDYIHGHALIRFSGLRKPGYPILGSDMIGEVIAVGEKVQTFKIGDLVWADTSDPLKYGTFAEFIVLKEKDVSRMPANINLIEAATLPTAGVVAYQNVFIKKEIKAGQRVLVNGAGGGIGTILVQLLKAKGADVTAVDKASKHEMLKSIGADQTIDYLEENYIDRDEKYDFIYDLVCFNKLRHIKKLLNKNGTLIILGGSTKNILKGFAFGWFLSLIYRRKIKVGGWQTNNHQDLAALSKLVTSGTIRPVVEKVIPFEELVNGLILLEEGQVLGKIVVDMSMEKSKTK